MFSHKKFSVAINIYEEIKLKKISMDSIVFVCAIRAAGYCRPWEYTMSLLDQSYELFNEDPKSIINIANTAMTNLKYIEITAKVKSYSHKSVFQKCEDILQWMIKKDINPSEQTMDIFLAVTCTHGSIEDCEIALKRRFEWNINPTIFTFNTLLNRCSTHGLVSQADKILEEMNKWGIDQDSTTFNTRLKLFVNINDYGSAMKGI